jgi:hypothetical protein
MGSQPERLLVGARDGLIATLAMTAFMLLADRRGWLNEQAPRTITRRTLAFAHQQPDDRSVDALTAAAHATFGTAAGGLHAVSVGRLARRPVSRLALGIGYGLAVWAASYWSVLPRLGLMPTPGRDERRRPEAMIAAHLIYGGVLGLLGARR